MTEGIENIGNYILWVGGIDDHYKTLDKAENSQARVGRKRV